MKNLKDWIKDSYRAYCAMAVKAVDCGILMDLGENESF